MAGHSVSLSWTAAIDKVDGYNVYRGTAPGTEGATPINTALVTGTTYVDNSVSPGTYDYYITSVLAGKESSHSNETAASVPNGTIILVSVAVTPVSPTVVVGSQQQFTATATYSDGSTQNVTSLALWSTSSSSLATITAAGLATGVAVGASTITASLSGILATQVLTITAASAFSLNLVNSKLSPGNDVCNITTTGAIRITITVTATSATGAKITKQFTNSNP